MRRGALALTALLCASAPARAYVSEQTTAGTPIAWRDNCPQLVLDATENPDLPHDRLRAALLDSAAAWNGPTAACDNPRITLSASASRDRDIAFDDVNLVIWRLPGFCADDKNAGDEVCLSPSLTALTTLFYYDHPGNARDGEILQADIEINATERRFADTGETGKMDVQDTMTHEFGHVLGLEHTCLSAIPSATVDAQGRAVPPCNPPTGLPADALAATMYPYQYAGETAKREPQRDETDGVCAIYSGHADNCASPGASGCQVSSRSLALPLGFGIVLLVSLLSYGVVRSSRRR